MDIQTTMAVYKTTVMGSTVATTHFSLLGSWWKVAKYEVEKSYKTDVLEWDRMGEQSLGVPSLWMV